MTEQRWRALPVVSSAAEAIDRGLTPGEFRLEGWSFEQHLASVRPATPAQPPAPDRVERMEAMRAEQQVADVSSRGQVTTFTESAAGVVIKISIDAGGMETPLDGTHAEAIGTVVSRRLSVAARAALDHVWATARERQQS